MTVIDPLQRKLTDLTVRVGLGLVGLSMIIVMAILVGEL